MLSSAQLEMYARSLARARAEGYKVVSSSPSFYIVGNGDPKHEYIIYRRGSRVLECTCDAARHDNYCKHRATVRAWVEDQRLQQLEADAARALASATPTPASDDDAVDLTDVQVPSPTPAPREWVDPLEPLIPTEPRPGIYTVVLNGGTRRTFKVRRQPEDREFMPGKLLISFLSGPDNTSDYQSYGMFSNGKLVIWKKFRQDSILAACAETLLNRERAEAAGYAYALESGNCYICGRTLTVPASINRGMGPICAAGGTDE